MFFGKWDATVDEKWRLTIPAAIPLNTFVMLKENVEGCIQISEVSRKFREKDASNIFIIRIEKGRGGVKKRILIPRYLRRSISFYLGRKVTIVGKGSYLEIWPRP